jgi:hypothetical protein
MLHKTDAVGFIKRELLKLTHGVSAKEYDFSVFCLVVIQHPPEKLRVPGAFYTDEDFSTLRHPLGFSRTVYRLVEAVPALQYIIGIAV